MWSAGGGGGYACSVLLESVEQHGEVGLNKNTKY